MVDAVGTYLATLHEVAVQLQLQPRRSGSGSDGSASSTPPGSGSGSGTVDTASDASGSSGWVVLESASTPAALPGATGGCSVWPQQQWQVAYEILFCQCPPAVARLRPHETDDMLFFVYTDEAAAAARTRLFVRRRQAKAAALPADLAAPPTAVAGAGAAAAAGAGAGGAPSKAALVDWRASVLLMVVLQTAYRMSVVTADDAELLNSVLEEEEVDADVAAGADGRGGGGASLRRVTKAVHASPSRVLINLDHSRSDAGRPQPSYPDICFAVDPCDTAFQSQVLRQAGDCYCVLLHAEVANSWSLPAAQAAAASGGPGSRGSGPAAADATAAAAAVASAAAGIAGLALTDSRRPGGTSSSGSSGGSGLQRLPGARGEGQGQGQEAAVVFSGYVSHAQLTAALGGQLAGDPVRLVLRAAAAAARGQPAAGPGAAQQQQQRGGRGAPGEGQQQQPLATCRVSMRGPGGVGAADVAVSSFPPAAPPAGDDAAHLPGTSSSSSSSSSSRRPNLLERAHLLTRGMVAAAKQAAAAAAGPKGSGAAAGAGGVPVEQLQLRCALMALQAPVDTLAHAILRAL